MLDRLFSARNCGRLIYCGHRIDNLDAVSTTEYSGCATWLARDNDRTEDTMYRKTFLILALVLTAACGGAASDGDESSMASVMCEDFVKGALRAPASAKFPILPDQTINRFDEDTYSVSSHVDSQNGFGAMLRSPYTCTVRNAGETWHLEALSLDGETIK